MEQTMHDADLHSTDSQQTALLRHGLATVARVVERCHSGIGTELVLRILTGQPADTLLEWRQSECARIGLDQPERFGPNKAPPWNWDRNPRWTVNTRLNGGSDKFCDQRFPITVDTIAAAG